MLGSIGDPAALPELEKLSSGIKPDKADQRTQLRDVILGMAKISAANPATCEGTGKVLAAHLDSIHEDIRAAASEAVGMLKYLPASAKLVAIMNRGSSARGPR